MRLGQPQELQYMLTHRSFFGAFIAGAYLVDTLTFLKHIPSWAPGAQWKRDGLAWAAEDRQVRKR